MSLSEQLAAAQKNADRSADAAVTLAHENQQLREQLAAERERFDDLQRSVMDLSHPNCKVLLNERNEARQQLAAFVQT